MDFDSDCGGPDSTPIDQNCLDSPTAASGKQIAPVSIQVRKCPWQLDQCFLQPMSVGEQSIDAVCHVIGEGKSDEGMMANTFELV